MFSKVRVVSKGIFQHLKASFSKKATQTVNKMNPKEEFIDASRFKEDILVLYQSKEAMSSRLISLGLLGFALYDGYLYYQSEDRFWESAEAIAAASMLVFLAIFEWKLRKTPRSIWLEKDGNTLFVEFYKFWGFSVNPIEFETRDFKGYGPYISRFNSVPIAKYSQFGKKKYFFFKTGYIVENDLLRKAFTGYTFRVGQSDMNVKLSNKAKSTYNLK
jgi:hypothetical protein